MKITSNWGNWKDFSPTCRKCNGSAEMVRPDQLFGPGRILFRVTCDECAGTGADAIPWSELFRDARLK